MGCATFDGKTRICQNVDRGELRVMRFQDSFYKSLTPEQNALAHANEYDLDSPNSIDFDLLVEKLKELKQGSVVSERQCNEREEQSNISRAGSALTSPSIPSRSINAKARPSLSIRPTWSYWKVSSLCTTPGSLSC